MANKPLKSIKFPELPDTYTIPQVDPTLTQPGQAADADETGRRLADLKKDINQTEIELVQLAGVIEELECGLTDRVKTALLACFTKVAWIDEDGQTYIDALEDALNYSHSLTSISAVFNQGSTVIYDTDELYALKQYLTVTGTYSDSVTKEVNNYSLSGELVAGTSTITVAYNKKTTTFNVTITHQQKILESITATFDSSVSITTDNVLDDLRSYLVVRGNYSDGTTEVLSNYTLSGSLNEGTNTITVTYDNKVTTFTVVVTAPTTTLQSISAVFNQGSSIIYTTDALDTLKQYLTVTGHYSNDTTQVVTSYTLSGTLTEGTSIITAIYGGKTATFDVVVTALPWDFEWNASTKQAPSNMEAQSFDFTTYPGFMYANNMNFYIENSVGDGEIEFHGFVPLHAYLETTPRIYLKSGDDGNMGVGFAWLFNCADGDGKTVRAWTGNNKNYLDIDQTVEADFRLKVENGIGYWFYNNELVFSSNDPTYDTQLLGTGFYTVVDNTYICISSIKYRKL